MDRRAVGRMLRFATLGFASALTIFLAAPARADVALCASFPTPSDAEALRRAPFAFDGVAIGGREVNDPDGGTVLVSPLTFRVSRWIKGDASYGVPLPSGAEDVSIWDGRYARLPGGPLKAYSIDVHRRFAGEMVVRPGEAWRIYGTNENGVNFTCTNLLGSHPLGPRTSQTPPSLGDDASSAGSRGTTRWVVGALALLGVTTLGAVAWTSAKRSGTKRNGAVPGRRRVSPTHRVPPGGIEPPHTV
jgi:hypothetical protein